jgi:cathepsin L
MGFAVTVVSFLALLALASCNPTPRVHRPVTPAAQATGVTGQKAPSVNGPTTHKPSGPHQDPNTVLNSPTFNASDANAWTQLFKHWASRMNKVYASPAAEKQAFETFKTSATAALKHNSGYRVGRHTYAVGLNKYSDLSFAEFTKRRLGLKPSPKPSSAPRGGFSAPISAGASAPPKVGGLITAPTVRSVSTGGLKWWGPTEKSAATTTTSSPFSTTTTPSTSTTTPSKATTTTATTSTTSTTSTTTARSATTTPGTVPSSSTMPISMATSTQPTMTSIQTLNYTATGCVTPVKDQEVCGACWAFGSTGAMESAYCKKTGKLVSLSEEQLVDCVTASEGCSGGWPTTAYDYVKTLGGLATEAAYPYTAGATGLTSACKVNQTNNLPFQLSYSVLAADDVTLMNALQTFGPIAVGVSVETGFQQYASGIMNPSTACGTTINHVVLLVGYGTDPITGLPYWLLKNSWGTTWGELGYCRLSRAIQNSCQINQLAASVQVN